VFRAADEPRDVFSCDLRQAYTPTKKQKNKNLQTEPNRINRRRVHRRAPGIRSIKVGNLSSGIDSIPRILVIRPAKALAPCPAALISIKRDGLSGPTKGRSAGRRWEGKNEEKSEELRSGLLSVISIIELARLAYGRNFAMVARTRCVCISEGRLREYCVSIGHTRANRGR